jgi:pyruvate,water dikinase
VPGGCSPATGIENDPAIVAGLIERTQASIAAMRREISTQAGPALFDFILQDMQELRRHLYEPQSSAAIRAAMDAAAWINKHIKQWLGDTNVADTLSQSAPNNNTSEMGLALLDVADAVRPYPQVVAYLQHADGETFFDGLARRWPPGRAALPRPRQVRKALPARSTSRGPLTEHRRRWSRRSSVTKMFARARVAEVRAGRHEAPREGARRARGVAAAS